MTTLRRHPWYVLTRHFFRGLFDLGFLTETGADSFTRMIVGCCAVFVSFGLLLTRIFTATHVRLQSADAFRLALLANHAFVIAVPMWIVAFVTVLIGHSLFPDETDFRVLMALPLPRRLIFGAKLLALAAFTALFALAAHVALLPLALLMSMGIVVGVAWPVQFTAYLVASLLASAFAAMALTALHGLLVLVTPRGRRLTVAPALRSTLLCVLVIALPFVMRLPGQARHFAAASAWLYAAPPVWFLGVERWLLADDSRPYIMPLTWIAGAAMTLATLLAAGSYLWLYRRFDRVLEKPAVGHARADRGAAWRRWSLPGRSRPVVGAIRTFTAITLRRSVLHQGILVALSAAGAGLVVNSLMAADVGGWMAGTEQAGRALTASAVWAPFALMFVASLAVRMALAVPIEPRANWIFRMTEHPDARADQLDAAVQIVRRIGVFLPLMITAPLEWLVLGRGAIGVLGVALLCGCLLVEILMTGWARIPFTCSYIPGKGFVPQSLLTGFSSFVLFTTAGAGLARLTAIGRPMSFALDAVVVAAVLIVRRGRLHASNVAPLAFEDHLPSEVNALQLSTD